MEITPEEIKQTEEELVYHYQCLGVPTPLAIKLVKEKIDKAIQGWDKAPLDFQHRITFLSKRKPENLNQSGKNRGISDKILAIRNKQLEDSQPNNGGLISNRRRYRKTNKNIKDSIKMESNTNNGEGLSKEEQRFYDIRKGDYERDFEFNKSSDYILLETVLLDEILLSRLHNDIRNRKDVDSEVIDIVSKRLRENLIKLGITREQREEIESNDDGNISSLSIKLDEKIKDIEKLLNKEEKDKFLYEIERKFNKDTSKELEMYAEEIFYLKKKTSRPPANNIPDFEKIKDIEKQFNG